MTTRLTLFMRCLIAAALVLAGIASTPIDARAADVMKPGVVSVSVSPSSVDVTDGPAEVTVTARLTDDQAVGSAYVYLRHPGFPGPSDTALAYLSRTSGTSQDGVWQATVTIGEDEPPGSWVYVLAVTDASGLQTVANGPGPNVESRDADVTKPGAVSVSVSPSSADVTDGPVQVTVTAQLTDDRAVGSAYVYLRHPSFAGPSDTAIAHFVRTSGTSQDGVWQATATIGEDEPPGSWVYVLAVTDASGLQTVANGPGPNVESRDADVMKPGVVSVSVSPSSVDVTDGPAEVTVTARLTDDQAVGSAYVYLRHPGFPGPSDTALAYFSRTSGTSQDGVWQATVTIGEDEPPGSWVYVLAVTDASGLQTVANGPGPKVGVPPETYLTAGPEGAVSSSAATFSFAADIDDATFECQFDNGDWSPCGSPAIYASLEDGEHTFRVRAIDPARHVDPSEATRTFTVDTAAPETRIDSGPSGATTSNSPSFGFSSADPDALFECRMDDDPWATCSSPRSFTGVAVGEHTFHVRARDAAGNVDTTAASRTFSVESPPPDSAPPSLVEFDFTPKSVDVSSGSRTVSVSARVTDATGAEPPYFLFSSTTTSQTAGFGQMLLSSGTTQDGVYTTTVTIPEGAAAGEWDAVLYPLKDTKGNSGSFGPPSGFPKTLQVASAEPDTAPPALAEFDFTPKTVDVTRGSRTVSVSARVTDATGAEPPYFLFSSRSTSQTAGFGQMVLSSGTAQDGVYTKTVTIPQGAAPGDWDAVLYPLGDTRGNSGSFGPPSGFPKTLQVIFDATPPQTTIDSGPVGPTTNATPTFVFSSSEAGSSFECRVDDTAFAECGTPYTTNDLVDGDHTFEVRATDGSANRDATPASRSFTVDTTAPQTTIASGPAALTRDSTPTVEFSASETGSRFECRVDAASFSACDSPTTTAVLSDGDHSFEVRAIDAAGNPDGSPASRSFTVDTAAPHTTMNSGPSGPISDSTPMFGFSSSESGSSFECRVDGASFASCDSPTATAVLTDGSHTFEVRATDAAGNPDVTPASRTFTVDTAAPQTTIASGPSGVSSDSTPTFAFSSSESGSTFECSVDGASFVACDSPKTTAALPDGDHSFDVRATDPARQPGHDCGQPDLRGGLGCAPDDDRLRPVRNHD